MRIQRYLVAANRQAVSERENKKAQKKKEERNRVNSATGREERETELIRRDTRDRTGISERCAESLSSRRISVFVNARSARHPERSTDSEHILPRSSPNRSMCAIDSRTRLRIFIAAH